MCSNAGIFIRDQGNVTEKKMCNCRKWSCPWNGTQAEGQEQQDEALPESPPETFTSLPPKPCPRGCASFPLGGILAEIKERNGCGPQSPLPQVLSQYGSGLQHTKFGEHISVPSIPFLFPQNSHPSHTENVFIPSKHLQNF